MVSSAKKSSRSISPSLAPVGDHLVDFTLDGGRVAFHLLTAQRRVVQHLLAPLRAGVEDNAFAEDRRHERIRLGLVEILVGRAEEELVGFGAGQQDDVFVRQLKPADIPALFADPSHQADRIGPELLEMAVFFFTARNPRHHSGSHLLTPRRSDSRRSSCREVMTHCLFSSASFWRSFVIVQRRLGLQLHVRDEATAGCLGDERDGSRQVRCAQEVVVTGLAPLGPIFQCRADFLGRQAPAHRGFRRTGVHNRRPHPGALEFHLQVGDHRDQRRFGRAVSAHMRPLAQRHVGADEDQVAALPVEHARQHRGGHPISADQVYLQLRVELFGGDLGELAEVGVARTGHQHLDVARGRRRTVRQRLLLNLDRSRPGGSRPPRRRRR